MSSAADDPVMPPFIDTRWVVLPDGVEALDGAGLPQGFRAGGVACGIKESGNLDLGLLVSDPRETVSAARFTRSGVLAAPVVVCKERCRLDAIRVVAANSGNANAATGGRGMDEAARMQGAAAMVGGAAENQVAVASTGVIGVQLDGSKIVKGMAAVRSTLAPDGDLQFAQAIRTTDKYLKRARLRISLSTGDVLLTAQAKGAGMIQPSFATMLCFVQTDAILSEETADLLLGVCVKRSFDRISVDGQLSTNDTVILQASGASGVQVEPQTADEARFGQALDALLRMLALLIVRDGEGSKRVGRVVVRGGDQRDVERTARAIANSPLVKAALHGGDPNWGRIAQAAGLAMADRAPVALDITIEGVPVCRRGAAIPFDQVALDHAVSGDEVEYEVVLPTEDGAEPTADTEVFFSDLSHEYVTINAEYTT